MSTNSLFTSVNQAAGRQTVYTTATWCEVIFQLDSGAGGTNTIGFGGNAQYRPVPGIPEKITVAPNTQIVIESTNAGAVNWSFIITELEWIVAVEQSRALLARLVAVLAPFPATGALPETEKERRQRLNDNGLVAAIVNNELEDRTEVRYSTMRGRRRYTKR